MINTQLIWNQASQRWLATNDLAKAILFIAVAVVLNACGGSEEEVDVTACNADTVSYDIYIQPLVANNCLGCHSSSVEGDDRNGAPSNINFDSYDELSSYAATAVARVVAGTMPPEGESAPAIGALSQDKRDCFAAWRDKDFREFAP